MQNFFLKFPQPLFAAPRHKQNPELTWLQGKAFRSRKSSTTTTPSLSTQSAPQILTPSDSAGTPVAFGTDPKLSFESYFQPLPGEMQPWQDNGVDWAALNDFELTNDWSWFGNSLDPNGGVEAVGGQPSGGLGDGQSTSNLGAPGPGQGMPTDNQGMGGTGMSLL